MPEAPEVDALTRLLGQQLRGARIDGTELEEPRALKTRGRPLREIEGCRVSGVQRRGKHASLDLGDRHLVISFGRAGWAMWHQDTAHVAAEETASEGESRAAVIARLSFEGDRMLELTDAGDWLSMGLWVVDVPSDVPGVAKLGPDPLREEIDFAAFDAMLGSRRKQLKALLQEQESLAGIGNAYSDEILHAARLSPVAHAVTLDAAQRQRLFEAVRQVLEDAAAARRGIPLDQQKAAKTAAMRVHGRTGENCPACGDMVRDVPASKGGAQYCPTCQTNGAPLDP